jgi:hypothetical protein
MIRKPIDNCQLTMDNWQLVLKPAPISLVGERSHSGTIVYWLCPLSIGSCLTNKKPSQE